MDVQFQNKNENFNKITMNVDHNNMRDSLSIMELFRKVGSL